MSGIIAWFLPYVMPLVLSAVGTYLAAKIGQLFNKWIEKSSNANSQVFLATLRDFAKQAVLAAEQSVVDTLKKQGKWGDQESYDKAIIAAYQSFMNLAKSEAPKLSKLGIDASSGAIRSGDMNPLVKNLLESALKELEVFLRQSGKSITETKS